MTNPLISRRATLQLGAALGLTLIALPAHAASRVSKTRKNIAIKGYDTTAYFKQAKAGKGEHTFSVEWNDATWHFVTQHEATLFAADPAFFAPQFGGFCTRAMSLKKVVHGDPEVWRIHGKKLYLFARPVGGEYFDKGEDAMIKKAQIHWDTLF